ncbi:MULTISPECIES: hypothetical protein [Streptomyces]|uniref:Uncharacterized protein n=1 Tax=Streptomyces dengpaensis TaxID=2049881 RepID=A0ABN5I9Y6_9ACTN|nr:MULTISPECIES: hypothetical protein [Streptomyces]AVH60014.1 hypothetical protein C4B68_34250 [Streptomyces dengpaensis]PIB09652.1 hypothetical protein B1C81_10925 [Streptomyces sp. HG99]
MDIYEVQGVEATATTQGTPIWMVAMGKPDGTIHAYAFPPSIIEWRMAEYQLDTVDEALDIVLHEPWATNPLDPLTRRDDAALRQGMVVRAPGPVVDYEPIRLHNADTIDDARTAHRIRIADAKTRVRVTPPKGKPDPLDIIRTRHGVTDEGLRQKAAHVDAARRSYRGEAVPGDPSLAIESQARQRLKEATSA